MTSFSVNQLFTGLTPEQQLVSARIAATVDFEKDQIICEAGAAGDAMYLIEQGSVLISHRTPQDREFSSETMGAGDFFGEMVVVDSGPRAARVTAAEPTRLRVIRAAELEQLLVLSPQVALNLMRRIASRLRQVNARWLEQTVYQEKLAMVGQMAGSIIHDFKSPLAIIRLAAEMIAQAKDGNRITRNCQMIERSVDRMTGLAEELLDFSRGQLQLNRQWVQPSHWLAELRELLQPLLEGKTIRCQLDGQTTVPWAIDAARLTRAIYNLASNAIEALGSKGDLVIRLTKPDDQFCIEITDNGPGIPEEIRSRLFDPFVSFGKRNGTGLGTSIAKKIIEEHGGTIYFKTATGQGTTFTIRIPAGSV